MIGMSPAKVKASSVWEFAAAVNGWAEANTTEDKGAVSKEESEALWEGVIERM